MVMPDLTRSQPSRMTSPEDDPYLDVIDVYHQEELQTRMEVG